MSQLLYYPTISVPPSDWTTRALLYYDKLNTIVPTEYFNDPERNYEPHMLELVRNELVAPIDPREVLDNRSEVNNTFLSYLSESEFPIDDRRKLFNKTNITYRIHSEKFDENLFYQLTELGLAKHGEGMWYNVEPFVASLLMSYLATLIGAKLNLQPATDKVGSTTTIQKDKKREIILDQLIPFPSEINIEGITKFKIKYEKLLIAFRNKVEQIVWNESIEEGSELFTIKLSEMDSQKEELLARMNENRFGQVIFGTVCGMIGAFQGLASAETPGAIIGALPSCAL